jgi:small subunit ribosomal protein S16
MAVKIRLTRLGKKKQPTYRVVVIDSRKQRDGEYIEQVGFYDPRQDPSVVEINNERALYWLHTGAQPTERAQKLLEISGAWTQFRVAKGDIHTIGGDEADAEVDEKALKKAKKAEKKARKAAEAEEAAKAEASSDEEAVEAVEPDVEVEEETVDSSEEV